MLTFYVTIFPRLTLGVRSTQAMIYGDHSQPAIRGYPDSADAESMSRPLLRRRAGQGQPLSQVRNLNERQGGAPGEP
jgi:hypothetical protein